MISETTTATVRSRRASPDAAAEAVTPAALLPAGGYVEWQPRTAPRQVVACAWTARLPDPVPPLRIVPDGCVDLIGDGRRLWVAGPDTVPAVERVLPGSTLVGVRLRPGTAAAVLGIPAAALRDQRATVTEVWGGDGERLAERIHRALAADGGPLAATGILEQAVRDRLASAPPPDPAVDAVIRRLAAAPAAASPSVAALADWVGYSQRQLLRRCTAAVGYGPTVLVRVLRFQRFLTAARTAPHRRLADLAVEAGYADQAHLAHETARLAGLPPSALLPSTASDPDKTPPGARRQAAMP